MTYGTIAHINVMWTTRVEELQSYLQPPRLSLVKSLLSLAVHSSVQSHLLVLVSHVRKVANADGDANQSKRHHYFILQNL